MFYCIVLYSNSTLNIYRTYIYTRIYKDTVAILASIGIIYLVALLGWGGVGWGWVGGKAILYCNIF